jgi:hypothetical protein
VTAAPRALGPSRRRLVRVPAAVPAVVVVLLAGLTFAACGSDGSGSMGSPASTSTSAAASGKPVAVDDAANGTTVELTRGARLTVTLHSTYWQLATPADASVLEVRSGPAARPNPSCRSIPGTGCGTVTAVYTAARTGTTMLTAHRASCGEALRCTPAQSDWSVKIRVSG